MLKKIHTLLLLILAQSFILTSCSNSINDIGQNEILLNASIEANKTKSLNVSVSPFKEGKDVFRVFAYKEKDVHYRLPYFFNEPVNHEHSLFAFIHPQYYPSSSEKLNFFAVAPSSKLKMKGTTAMWQLTGKEDLLYASDLSGISKFDGRQPFLVFRHHLMKINFLVDKYTSTKNESIKKIIIKSVKYDANLDLTTETLLYTQRKKDITAFSSDVGLKLEEASKVKFGTVYVPPVREIELSIITDTSTYSDIVVSLDQHENNKGKGYCVKLNFSQDEILPVVIISPWDELIQEIDIE